MHLLYKTQKAGHWLTVREVALRWLEERRQLPADAVTELRTKGNTLSVYELDDRRSNAARIVAAILSKSSGGLDHTDCLVFDSEIVSTIGIPMNRNAGQTPDTVANAWHLDLAEITGLQLVKLAEELVRRAELLPLLEPELISALRAADIEGDVERELLGKNVKRQIGL